MLLLQSFFAVLGATLAITGGVGVSDQEHSGVLQIAYCILALFGGFIFLFAVSGIGR